MLNLDNNQIAFGKGFLSEIASHEKAGVH